jgi:uncharacterized protein YprB with RNaseH-like and TPR domain
VKANRRGRPSELELLPKPHVLVLDIETSSLEADKGHLLCAAARYLGTKRMLTWRIDDTPGYGSTPASFTNDGPMVAAIIAEVNRADAVAAYYGGDGRFDLPYLSARAVYHGLEPVRPGTYCLDPHKVAKKRLRLSRNSLDVVSRLLGSPQVKGHEPFKVWQLAQHGSRTSLSKILRYNIGDVQVLEHTLQRIRPLMTERDFPRLITPVDDLQRDTQCPGCGSLNTQNRGLRATRTGTTERRQCSECKVWFAGRREKSAA